MANLDFNTIRFGPLSLDEYKKRYRASIRVDFDVDKVRGIQPGMVMPNATHPLNLTWSKEPKVVYKGSTSALVRLPAMIVDGEIYILDGHHRLIELQPRWVVLDTLHFEEEHLHLYKHLIGR